MRVAYVCERLVEGKTSSETFKFKTSFWIGLLAPVSVFADYRQRAVNAVLKFLVLCLPLLKQPSLLPAVGSPQRSRWSSRQQLPSA